MEVDDFELLELVNDYQERSDAVFDSGDITKEEALTILTDNKLLYGLHVST